MNCIKCGRPLAISSKFCAVCGTPVSAPVTMPISAPVYAPVYAPVTMPISAQASAPVYAQASAPAAGGPAVSGKAAGAGKKSSSKWILIALAAVAVIAIFAVGAYLAVTKLTGSGSGTGYPASTPLLLISGEDGVSIFGGDKKPVVIEGLKQKYVYSPDGKSVAVTVDADENGLADLWFCDGKKAVLVSENVYYYIFSDSGNKIAYLTDFDAKKSAGDLSVYDTKSKKSKLIAGDSYYIYTLSPNGASIAYATDVSMDDSGSVNGFTGYASIDGAKAIELGKNKLAFGLADGGKYIYCLEADFEAEDTATLYIRHEKKDDKIGIIDMTQSFAFNRDYSQVMFVKGGSTYICVNGAAKEKVSGSALRGICVPSGTQLNWNGYCNIGSLSDQLLNLGTTSGDGTTNVSYSYLKKDLSTVDLDELTKGQSGYTFVSQNGKSFYYIDDSGRILYYKDYRDTKAKAVKIEADEDIVSFIVMPDLSAVYYTDINNTLWVQRGTGDPEEIAQDIRPNSTLVSKDGKAIYYIADNKTSDTGPGGGVLNYLKNAAKAKPVEIAEDVFGVAVSDFGTVYYVFDHTDEKTGASISEAFFSQNDKDFTSIMDNAMN